MSSLLTNQSEIAAQVNEKIKTDIDECNLGVRYNKTRLMEFIKESIDAIIKKIFRRKRVFGGGVRMMMM